MPANALQNIAQIEASLWAGADQLRANSKLTSNEYCMPVLGVKGGFVDLIDVGYVSEEKADFGADYERLISAARVNYAQEGGLEKNDLFIAEWVTAARREQFASATLGKLCASNLTFAREAV